MRIFQGTKPLAERERTINRVVRPLADSDLAIAFRHLSVLLDGGVSLVDSLTDLARIDPRVRVQQRWVAIARQVEQGHSLSSAVNAAGLTRHEEVSATLAAAEIDGSLSLACAAMDACGSRASCRTPPCKTCSYWSSSQVLWCLRYGTFLNVTGLAIPLSSLPTLEFFSVCAYTDLHW